MRVADAEGQRWLEQALASVGTDAPARLRAKALIELSHLVRYQGIDSGDVARTALDLAHQARDRALESRAHYALFLKAHVRGDRSAARPHAEQALAHAETAADDVLITLAERAMACAVPSEEAAPHIARAVAGMRR